MSTERVIIQRGVYQAIISAVTAYCQKLKAGDPTTDSTAKLSALFSEGSAENVLNMVREAKEAGAELLLGDLKRQGSVVQPHLLTSVKPGMRVWDKETFGPGTRNRSYVFASRLIPLIPVIVFSVVDTIDEAIELANATDYSLSASLWTSNVHTALEVAPRIRSG